MHNHPAWKSAELVLQNSCLRVGFILCIRVLAAFMTHSRKKQTLRIYSDFLSVALPRREEKRWAFHSVTHPRSKDTR